MSSSPFPRFRGLVCGDRVEHQRIVTRLLEDDSDVLARSCPAEADWITRCPARRCRAVALAENLVHLVLGDPVSFGDDVVVIPLLIVFVVPDDRRVHVAPWKRLHLVVL